MRPVAILSPLLRRTKRFSAPGVFAPPLTYSHFFLPRAQNWQGRPLLPGGGLPVHNSEGSFAYGQGFFEAVAF